LCQAQPDVCVSLGLLDAFPGPGPAGSALVVAWQRLYEELLPSLDTLLSTLPGADQQQWGAAAQAALGTAKLQVLACLRALLVASTTTSGAPTGPRVPSEHGTWADTVQRLLTASDEPADGPHAGAYLRDAVVLFGFALRTALTTDDDSDGGGGGGGTGEYLYEAIVASADAAHTATLLPERLRQRHTAAPAPTSRSPASATSSSPAPAAAASAALAVDLQDPSEAVRALKDLFPAYGDGFLLACLAAFDHRYADDCTSWAPFSRLFPRLC